MFIVLANATLAQYPDGGGHWAWFLQYPLGLKQLGHRVLWLEILQSTGDRHTDIQMVRGFFERIAEYNLDRNVAVVVVERTPLRNLDIAQPYGKSKREILEAIRSADLLYNFWYGMHEPLLLESPRRAFIDVDPGHTQICASLDILSIGTHHTYLTVGANVNQPDCSMPRVGVAWCPFRPFAYLPMWRAASDPGACAPFTSITQWTWEELPWNGGLVSVSKRAAYLKYREIPRLAGRPFEIAANIGDEDPAGDRDHMREGGWRLTEPHDAAGTPAQYQEYIRASRAEFMCPKPIHLVMRTGWFSDRSVAYLASGRPVLAEETGFSERLPTGAGLIAFRNVEEALDGIAEIDGNYERHRRAARDLAESLFDSRKCLTEMLSACGA